MQQNIKSGWRKWKAISDAATNVLARVLLTVFYFTVMAPFGLWQGVFADRLVLRRPETGSFWVDRSTRDRSLDDGRKQF